MRPKIKLSSRFEPSPHLPLSVSLAENSTKICELYIKRLLSAALNSSLNGFSSGEEIFSKKPRRREGHYCFNPLTSSHFKTFLEGEMASCLPNPNLNPSGPGSCWRQQCSLHLSISCIPTDHAFTRRKIKLNTVLILKSPCKGLRRRDDRYSIFAYHLINTCVVTHLAALILF